jgi:integrase
MNTNPPDLRPSGEDISPAAELSAEALLNAISGDFELSATRRRDLRCALNKLCVALSLSRRDVVLTPDLLRQWRKLAGKLSVSEKRAQNIRSDLQAIFERYVRPATQALANVPFSAEWQRLRAFAAGVPEVQYGLGQLMRFCSLNRIEPNEFNNAAFRKFCDWLAEAGTRKDPKRAASLVRNAWNRAAVRVQGWPSIRIDNPTPQVPYVLPWSQFPDSLGADVAAWKACIHEADPFDERAPAKPHKRCSIEHLDFLLRAAASGIVAEGRPARELRTLADLVCPDNARLIFTFMRKRLRKEQSSQMAQIAGLLRSIAKHWVDAPDSWVAHLRKARRTFSPNPFEISSKNRERLAQLKDPEKVLTLVTLPQRLAQRALRKPNKMRMADVYALEAALLIEIELMFPLRRKNLSELKIGESIRVIGTGPTRQLQIAIPGDEVKNGLSLLARLPKQSTWIYDAYVEHGRPRLSEEPSQFLFPGPNGHRDPATLSRRVTSAVRKAAGIEINLHCFRHVAALNLQTGHGAAYDDIRRALAHTNLETGVRYYADLENQTAIDRLHQCVLQLRGPNG